MAKLVGLEGKTRLISGLKRNEYFDKGVFVI